MGDATGRAIEIAKRDFEEARKTVRQCEFDLSRARAAAREADQRLKAMQGKPGREKA